NRHMPKDIAQTIGPTFFSGDQVAVAFVFANLVRITVFFQPACHWRNSITWADIRLQLEAMGKARKLVPRTYSRKLRASRIILGVLRITQRVVEITKKPMVVKNHQLL